jgi:DNA invertase Pin-like site-specific DNA recombinase
MERIYRAAKYIRTSSPDDELQDSVSNQGKLIDGFLRAHPEIIVVAEKIDEGHSGVFFNRPSFNEMIADIKAGHIDCVLVKDISRFGRCYIEIGKYLRDLFQANDVRLISVDDNIDSALMDEYDKTIILIKSIIGEQYSRDVSIKTRSSLDIKRRQGKYVGAVPIYGYTKSDENRHKLSLDSNTYTVVQSIYNMKLQGMSDAGIASELNESGILSPITYKRKQSIPFPAGGFADKCEARWSATTVLRILRDENYTGTLVQGRQRSPNYKSKTILTLDESEWAKSENAHPPIISKMDYDAVQRALALDTRIPPGHKRVHVFSGLLICGCCGSNMTRKTCGNYGRKYIYYFCPTTKNRGCLLSYMVGESALMQIVAQKIKERIGNIQKMARSISATHVKKLIRTEYSQRIAICNQSICELHNFNAYLRDNLLHGIIDYAEFQSLQVYYDGEITNLSAEIAIMQKTS